MAAIISSLPALPFAISVFRPVVPTGTPCRGIDGVHGGGVARYGRHRHAQHVDAQQWRRTQSARHPSPSADCLISEPAFEARAPLPHLQRCGRLTNPWAMSPSLKRTAQPVVVGIGHFQKVRAARMGG